MTKARAAMTGASLNGRAALITLALSPIASTLLASSPEVAWISAAARAAGTGKLSAAAAGCTRVLTVSADVPAITRPVPQNNMRRARANWDQLVLRAPFSGAVGASQGSGRGAHRRKFAPRR